MSQKHNMKKQEISREKQDGVPMMIGPVHLQSPFILAPLAGYTDLAFRLLCREMGAALCCSEMISCHGVVYGQKKTLAMLATVPEERPVAFQIFGNEPEIMGEAAAIVGSQPIDFIDINMGCPVRKVIRKGAGAALMKNFQRAEAVIRAVCDKTDKPVTIKFRSGWNSETVVAAEFARMARNAGVQAVTIHARTWAQGFGGRPDWQVIRAVKQAVTIPVIGNGDIQCYGEGLKMMSETGCDGVMIGRGALGNPWVFRPEGRPATLGGRLPVIRRHLELAQRFLPAERLLFRIKNHAGRYLAGLHGAGKLRRKITDCSSLAQIIDLFENL